MVRIINVEPHDEDNKVRCLTLPLSQALQILAERHLSVVRCQRLEVVLLLGDVQAKPASQPLTRA